MTFFTLVLTCAVYILPLVVAIINKSKYAWFVLAMNVILGWLPVFWVGALVLALQKDDERRQPKRDKSYKLKELDSLTMECGLVDGIYGERAPLEEVGAAGNYRLGIKCNIIC